MYLPYSGWNTGGMTLRAQSQKRGKVISALGGVGMAERQGSNSRGTCLCVHVICQGLQLGENGGLAEREHGVFGVWIELYYHVLDLQRAGMSSHGGDAPSDREYLVSP